MNFYAGVGSRDTPDNILNIMHHIGAYLAKQGWVLRSGAASGADASFEEGALTEHGETEIYLPWQGYNHHKGELHPQKYPFSEGEISFAAMCHPGWKNCTAGARKMHTRNVRIVMGTEHLHGPLVQASRFIVAWTERGLLKGGTAQALRIAKEVNIPIINLGKATSPEELENLVLKIDEIQTKLKNKVILG